MHKGLVVQHQFAINEIATALPVDRSGDAASMDRHP